MADGAIQARLADTHTAANLGAGNNKGMLANMNVMRNVHMVVNLSAVLNESIRQGAAAYGGERADLDIITDTNVADMR